MKRIHQSVLSGFFTGFFVLRPSPLVFLLSLLLFPSVSSAELIDRIVASVNNDVITLSEMNQAIAFNSMGGGNTENIRSQTLEGLINRRLLIQEARRLKFVDVSEHDIRAEIEKLKKTLGTEKSFSDFLTRVDMTRDQLELLLGERLLVERFVEKKIGLFIRVTREEAEEHFARNAARFPGKQFADVQQAITEELSERELDKQISEYLAEIRSRADIRIQL